MTPAIPWYIESIVIATNLAVAVVAWGILSVGASRSGLPSATRRRVRIGGAGYLGAWLGAALALAPPSATVLAADPLALTPLVPLFILAPTSIAILGIALSPTLRKVAAAAPLPMVVGVQVYRLIGAVFVVLLAQGQLPAHFALPAGWGDIAVGLGAPLVALALARRLGGARALAVGWNVFGLLDLIVAVGMGSGVLVPLLVPELGARVAPAPAMGVFPMILVPMFLVPVSGLLHLVALWRLWRESVPLSGPTRPGRRRPPGTVRGTSPVR